MKRGTTSLVSHQVFGRIFSTRFGVNQIPILILRLHLFVLFLTLAYPSCTPWDGIFPEPTPRAFPSAESEPCGNIEDKPPMFHLHG